MMKYIKLFESTDASVKIRSLKGLNLLTNEDTYANKIVRQSPYFNDSKVVVNYDLQTITVETEFDETLGNVCDMYGIPVNSYALDQAERSLYTTVTILYDFEQSNITYKVRISQKDLGLNSEDQTTVPMRDKELDWTILDIDRTAKFIAEDLSDYLGEATDKASELLTTFLSKKGYSDFV